MPLPLSEHASLDGKKKAEAVRQLHKKAQTNIEKRMKQFAKHANKGRRQLLFKPGDWVWLHMRKERFPEKRQSKLMPHGDGQFQILAKVDDNAYQLDLLGEYGVSSTFNVADLFPFDVGDNFDLRTNPSQEEGTDEEPPRTLVVASRGSSEVLSAPLMNLGPMTRARARKIRETLQTFLQIVRTCVGGIQENHHTLVNLLQAHEGAAGD
nr:uncharacterized protein LOC113696743 [Coffea arabica]